MRGTDKRYMSTKRLGILVIFADGGEIEKSALYLAQSVADMVEHLCLIINGNPREEAVENAKSITESVYIRENTGYDSGAFKYALEEILGWEEIHKYKELMLVNDSCFGPIYPLEDMFRSMEEKECDFWGVTDQPEIKRGSFSDALIPYHIQSYFMVIRERMLKSKEFADFWKQMKLSDIYELVVDNFELEFTKYFVQHGYIAAAYIDGKEFCKSVEETQAYVFFDSYRLIRDYKCPLLKKKVFLFPEQDILASNAGETARKTLEYVEKETSYDADLIWDYLIKKSDLYELRNVLHLDYICSKERLQCEETEDDEIGIILIAHSSEMVSECRTYVKALGANIQLHVIFAEEKRAASEAMHRKILCDYEYVCVINEGKIFSDTHLRKTHVNALLENAIGSYVYVQNVLDVFRKNKRLGILTLPKPVVSDVPVENFENSVTYGYWARTASLQHGVDSVCAAKKNGYFIGEIVQDGYASDLIAKYADILNHLIGDVVLENGVEEFRYLFSVNREIVNFVRKYEKIYVYGAGEYGGYCIHFLEENAICIQGVIVSSGRKYAEHFLSYPVYEFSEMELTEDVGVIVALNEKNTQAVVQMMKENAFSDFICFSE